MILELKQYGISALTLVVGLETLEGRCPLCHFSVDVQQGGLYYRRNTL